MGTVTILDEGRETVVDGEIEGAIDGGRVVLPAPSLEAALGFVRKPEGLCKGDICIPVRPGAGLEAGDGYDVSRLASILGRPMAVDAGAGVASVGAAPDSRAAQLRSLEAPDFALPDLDGRLHSLSEHRGKKVILVAYASW